MGYRYDNIKYVVIFKVFYFWLILVFPVLVKTQEVLSFTVELEKPSASLAFPVCIDLDGYPYYEWDDLELWIAERDGSYSALPFQLSAENGYELCFMMPKGESRTKIPLKLKIKESFEVDYSAESEILVTVANGVVVFRLDKKPLVQYQMDVVYPPEGVESAYARGGFIHPLLTPKGKVLTRIQPEDHYHHYGIWNPWTQVAFRGDTLDFWNLAKEEGTIRPVYLTGLEFGNVFGSLEAMHEHVVLKQGKEVVALKERHRITVFPVDNEPYYWMDLEFTYHCATSSPFSILKYRYEGLGWRATEKWNAENSRILSSTGKTRSDIDGSKEKWALVQGQLDEDSGGILLMSHPSNFNHPEPMRVWPPGMPATGDVFVTFSTTKDRNWVLNPSKTYKLKYRFLVFDGEMDDAHADEAWNAWEVKYKIND